ncbi:MAG: diphthine--ammonia ligase [Actinomycetota bacterium]
MKNNGLNAFSSWSGGKDSCLALHRSLAGGNAVTVLLTILHESGGFLRTHGTPRALIQRQAESLGLSIRFGNSTWEGYESAFKEEIAGLKAGGVGAGVFGDIDLAEHREWIERVCAEVEIEPLLPLWGEKRGDLVAEFIDLGYRAMIISVRKGTLSGDWLGKTLDRPALSALEEQGVDAAGEGGEYHTFVYAGPLFRHAVDLRPGGIEERDGMLRLQLET